MSEKNKNIASAKAKSIKTGMTKVNLVLKMIRGKKAENALNILAFSKKRISDPKISSRHQKLTKEVLFALKTFLFIQNRPDL